MHFYFKYSSINKSVITFDLHFKEIQQYSLYRAAVQYSLSISTQIHLCTCITRHAASIVALIFSHTLKLFSFYSCLICTLCLACAFSIMWVEGVFIIVIAVELLVSVRILFFVYFRDQLIALNQGWLISQTYRHTR